MSKRKKKTNPQTLVEDQVFASPNLPHETNSFFESDLFWRAGCLLVMVVTIGLRFYHLSLKPFHHDEGVNGFFLINLFRSGVYKYDPQNYHGPTLYFFTLASSYLFGLTDFAVRFIPVLFGVLCVVGVLYLRRYLGTVGALSAALLVALSPGMVYISRYFIHEMLFVFFTLAVPLAIVKFMERDRVGNVAVITMSVLLMICLLPGTLSFAASFSGNEETRNIARVVFFIVEAGIVFMLMRALVQWEDGRPIYLLLASAALVLTFATKETAFISFGTMLIAVVCIFIWQKIWKTERQADLPNDEFLSVNTFVNRFSDPLAAALTAVFCAALFAYVGALFFSSFFTYNEGIRGAFEAYDFWTKTGSKDHTQNGMWAYLKWLWKLEAPLLILGAIGALIAFWKGKHKFAMFSALWAWGLLAAYTIIPYKTPWLAVNFVFPLALISGYAVNEMVNSRDTVQRGFAAFMAAVAFGVCAYQSVDLNFYSYDDDTKPYVYAHTRREFFDLLREIERVAEASGKGKEASILIVSSEYWSMPWYLRDYKGAAFYGRIYPSETSEIIIGKKEQQAELEREYGQHYLYTGTYILRPGVDLQMYVRKDLAEKTTGK